MSQMSPTNMSVSLIKVEIVPLTFSILALLIGGLPAYMIYVKKSIPPERFTKGPITRIIYKLLTKGYYFDAVYNYVFLNGISFISDRVRKIQTGILNINMLTFTLGILLLILLIFQGGLL